jgi:uncharacterized iron-regulated membrane protein
VGGVVLNTNMLNVINYLVLIVMLVVGFIFVWELLKGRTVPPFRIERAKRPLWYWLCVVTHGMLLAFIFLFCVAQALESFFNGFFN